MSRKIVSLACLLIATSLFMTQYSLGQGGATIRGVVKDKASGEPLPSANVLIVGTSIGAATDMDGKYTIRDAPTGMRTLRASYLGYNPLEVRVEVTAGGNIKQDFRLDAVGIVTEGVTVTAQAKGQNEAINQQLTSMPVMSVVSEARIKELPDANAAESVARLPGVSIIRTGGEGAKVVIRGLSPQYNQITIDGVELPSDVASGNNLTSGDKGAQEGQSNVLGDRAEDLSMISSNMLGGIEVIKAITPDMDATLIGGVVNFGMRKASKSITTAEGTPTGFTWVPGMEFWVQSGYNNLKNTYNDYKFGGALEKRFFDEKLGVYLQASGEQRNLSANELGAGYTLNDKDHGDAGIPDLTSLDLRDVYRTRNRAGGTLVLDYQHETGEIGLMNFYSASKTQAVNRGQSYYPTSNDVWYSAGETNNELNVLSNMLSIKQEIPLFNVSFRLSHSYSESSNPEDLSFNFWQHDIGFNNMPNVRRLPPKDMADLAQLNSANAALVDITTSESFLDERTITGNLDLLTNIVLSDDLSAKIKFGGMIQQRTRDYDYNTSSGSQRYSGGGGVVTAFTQAYPWLILEGGGLGFRNFVYDGYDYGTFLNGDYNLPYPINVDFMWTLLPLAKKTSTLEGYQKNVLGTEINDYSGTETKSAAYVQLTLDIGDQISILPGVRYQNLTTDYTAMQGILVPGGLQGGEATAKESHGYWLPMVHLRYKPMEWLQFHFAYTNTINYPDYSTITPRFLVGTGYITYNNSRIKPALSENMELVASLHSNEIGLLSANGFKKKIKDLIFFSKRYLSDLSAYPELPQGGGVLYEFNTYINNPTPIDVYGIEAEWQTHFWYLPGPLTGLVFTVNYTHIFSEATYPKTSLTTIYNEDGTYTQIVSDTGYTTRLLNQPNDIVNLVMGYDYGDFSARVSMLYQDNIFKRPDFWMQQRVNSDKYTRWDISVKQKLPWFGLQVYFNISNVTGADEIDVNQKTGFPANEQRYGMTADLGLRIKL